MAATRERTGRRTPNRDHRHRAASTRLAGTSRSSRAGCARDACGIGELTVVENGGFHSSCAAEVGDLTLPEGLPPPLVRRSIAFRQSSR
jgi:hypothetical protein